MRALSIIISILIIICLNAEVAAQDYIVRTEHYGIEEGLSHENIQTIHQDDRGLIWLGTMYGLNRFDGYKFKWFTKEKHGLQSNVIDHIFKDEDGWLWLFNTSFQQHHKVHSIDLFHPVTEEVVSFEERFGDDLPFSFKDITSFAFSDTGTAAFVLNEQKLALFSVNSGFELYDLGAVPFEVNGFSKHKTLFGYSSKGEDDLRDIILEIDLQGKVLNRYSHKFPFQYNYIAGVDKDDNLLYLLKQWNNSRFNDQQQKGHLFKIDSKGKETEILLNTSALPKDSVDLDIPTYGNEHGFWVNPLSGDFWLFGRGSFQGFNPATGWYADLGKSHKELVQPNDVYFDKTGRTWVATVFGLTLIEINKNPFYSLAHDKSNINLLGFRGITEDKQNTIWACIDRGDGWLGRFKKEKGKFSSKIIGPEKAEWGGGYKYGIFSDTKGLLWFASRRDSVITKLNPVDSSFQLLPYVVPGKGKVNIWSFYEDKDGLVWFGTDKGIVGYVSGNDSVTMLPEMEGVTREGGCIYQIFEDKQGVTWAVTDGGVYILDRKNKTISPYNSLELPFLKTGAYHIYEDAEGVFWIGTNDRGLIRWVPHTEIYQQFTKADGLSDNTIYGIHEDDYRNLWLSSNYGIIQFDKENFQNKAYLEKDGTSGHEFNRSSHFQSKDGTLFFGGINGITAFHPRDLARNDFSFDSPVVLTQFQQFDGEENKLKDRTTELLESGVITILPDDRFFRLEFSLLNFSNIAGIQYGYLIEGVDQDWFYQKENSIRLSRLPYGKYILKIKGQAPNGQWSENELSVKIVVLKPFYLQTWFLVICSILFLGSGPLIYKIRTGQLERQKKELEGEVARRTETINKQSEELKSLERLKSRFFANVSHELRTPLTMMLGPVSRILNKNNISGENKKMLEFVQRHGKQLLKLVNEILDISKLETGQMKMNESAVNLNMFLGPLALQFSSFAESSGINFEFDCRTAENLNLLTDADKIEKILINFLSNAFKFTPQGGKVILIAEERYSTILTKVTDTGSGIHPSDLPYVFDRFYQSRQPGTPVQGGTGIGLSFCSELANLLGGKVWAESELEKGSTFFFEFPKKLTASENLETVPPPQIFVSNSDPAQSDASQKSATLMIVEDNDDLREYLRVLLVDDYKIITAKNGMVAFELLKSLQSKTEKEETYHLPDLILSDLMMPVMDGYQLLEKIKNKAEFMDLPVIMVTARSDIKVKMRALRIGVDDYLVKPFLEDELKLRIKNLLRFAKARYAARNEEIMPGDEETETISSFDAEWLESVEHLLTKKIADPVFKMDWVASQLFLSQRQFRRKLKQLTGMAPSEYLREMRLCLARDFLLVRKYRTLKATAAAVGYSKTDYFSKLYFNRFGIRPADYLS